MSYNFDIIIYKEDSYKLRGNLLTHQDVLLTYVSFLLESFQMNDPANKFLNNL